MLLLVSRPLPHAIFHIIIVSSSEPFKPSLAMPLLARAFQNGVNNLLDDCVAINCCFLALQLTIMNLDSKPCF